MQYRRYKDIDQYYSAVYDDLMKNEPLNELILTMKGRQLDWSETNFLGTVTDGGRLALAAVCTPPHNVVLRDPNGLCCKEALACFTRETKAEGLEFGGVQAEPALAEAFAEVYGLDIEEAEKTLVLMRLDAPPEPSGLRGAMRAIEERDMAFLPYWGSAFSEDCHMIAGSFCELHDRFIGWLRDKSVFIWEVNGVPVSMAASTRGTLNGAAVNYVYTPPFWRGKEYAFACVSALSRKLMLENGWKYCYLYADLNNPISNHIYHKIGYIDINKIMDIRFAKA